MKALVPHFATLCVLGSLGACSIGSPIIGAFGEPSSEKDEPCVSSCSAYAPAAPMPFPSEFPRQVEGTAQCGNLTSLASEWPPPENIEHAAIEWTITTDQSVTDIDVSCTRLKIRIEEQSNLLLENVSLDRVELEVEGEGTLVFRNANLKDSFLQVGMSAVVIEASQVSRSALVLRGANLTIDATEVERSDIDSPDAVVELSYSELTSSHCRFGRSAIQSCDFLQTAIAAKHLHSRGDHFSITSLHLENGTFAGSALYSSEVDTDIDLSFYRSELEQSTLRSRDAKERIHLESTLVKRSAIEGSLEAADSRLEQSSVFGSSVLFASCWLRDCCLYQAGELMIADSELACTAASPELGKEDGCLTTSETASWSELFVEPPKPCGLRLPFDDPPLLHR